LVIVDHCEVTCRLGSVPATNASLSVRPPPPESRPL